MAEERMAAWEAGEKEDNRGSKKEKTNYNGKEKEKEREVKSAEQACGVLLKQPLCG